MFTGIIEEIGRIKHIEKEGSNIHFTVAADFTKELKIDQSVCHNGACLTVVEIFEDSYRVTAIEETLQKTNLSDLSKDSVVNLERAMKLGDRLDGHIVQGHVDGTAVCTKIEDENGSTLFYFEHSHPEFNTVEKGSVTVDGVSLTVVDSRKGTFSVAIIPYTLKHTNFHTFKAGSRVNIEFDVIGKYVQNLVKPYL